MDACIEVVLFNVFTKQCNRVNEDLSKSVHCFINVVVFTTRVLSKVVENMFSHCLNQLQA